MITTSVYLLHRNPRFWPDPLRFDPTRFLDRRVRPTEFVPFGGGSRTCFGAAFALFESKIILARMLTRAEMHAVPGAQATVVMRGPLLGPSHAMPVVLDGRAPRAVVNAA